jgi:hypothetical protein
MRSVGEGFSFYFGGLRVETCSLDATSVIVTVYNEVGKFCKRGYFGGVVNIA